MLCLDNRKFRLWMTICNFAKHCHLHAQTSRGPQSPLEDAIRHRYLSGNFSWLKPENITPRLSFFEQHPHSLMHRITKVHAKKRKISVCPWKYGVQQNPENIIAQPIWSRLLAGLTAVDGAPPRKLHACHGTGSSDSPGDTQWMRKVNGQFCVLSEDKITVAVYKQTNTSTLWESEHHVALRTEFVIATRLWSEDLRWHLHCHVHQIIRFGKGA